MVGNQHSSIRRFGALLATLGLGAGFGAASDAEARKKKKKKKKPKGCKNGAARCGSACVDIKTNALHCGGCGRVCGENVACVDGQCQGGGCPGNQILCGALCVNPNNDEAHCGRCNSPCNGDLTCLNGECGCAEDTKCGNECVDTDTDPDHCGDCNEGCNNDETCVGGECNPSGRGPDQIDCGGGLCIPAHEHACCSQTDCGGPMGDFNDLVCDQGLKRCVCGGSKAGQGICLRTTDGRGLCRSCCPGDTQVKPCPGEQICRNGACNCPEERPELCPFGRPWACSMDLDTDPHRCGQNCVDCEEQDPGARCCKQQCFRGGGPNRDGNQHKHMCGSDCGPCPGEQICCNRGAGTSPQCVFPSSITGRCPNLDE